MKPCLLLASAQNDAKEATRYYRRTGGNRLARRFVAKIRASLESIARQPAIGSLRYADPVGIPNVRFVALNKFPYLVFYLDRGQHIAVIRLLHGLRDLPTLLGDAAER
ncbi:Plasmid stabilization system [Candidatus Accumulibacter aalborgensis]|uniref:Plasmid stabilization system n=1 Tax=Candidatus Accumulibacter aalborgensis TaxID=1860102 RepID=A0A1A8XYZ8_9PROT|nr:Plasmid stabilization system [Candidatus Accumulibacter aalborgensis]